MRRVPPCFLMFWASLCLPLLSLTAQAGDPPSSPPDSDSWTRIEPLDSLKTLRAFVTPHVIGEDLVLRIEGPNAKNAHILKLDILTDGGNPVEARIRDGEVLGHRVRIVRVDARDWEDGSYELTLRLNPEAPEEADAADAEDATSPPPPKAEVEVVRDFEVIRGALAAIPDETHRAEIAVWIEDHNRQHPIWNVIPAWINLPRALRQGADGDPYAQLRGFLLRAYPNPQLRRMQPYTVYVPEELDLSEPAPLLILLHGSGGDYRNLVADHASGQRFETHPMLIANAGAFSHQEFRHMALNDVRWILEDMKRKYRIDPDRIYAQGVSLGGRGVLELAGWMPDTFAAVSSQGVYGVMPYLLDPHWMGVVDPVRLRIELSKDIRFLLPRMQHVPVEIFVQLQDTLTPPVNARVIASWLHHARWGRSGAGEVVVRTFDTGHDITLPVYDWGSTREWMLQHRRRPVIGHPPPPGHRPQGPIWTIWQKPVIYVYDDTQAEEVTTRLRASAEASAVSDITFGDTRLPVRAWSGLTEEERRTNNLVWFRTGGGEASAAVGVPLPAETEALRGVVESSTIRMALRPSPWSEGHRVLVVEVDGTRVLDLNAVSLWDSGFRTDWVVGVDGLGGGMRMTGAGFYGEDWEPAAGEFTLHDPRGPMVLRY